MENLNENVVKKSKFKKWKWIGLAVLIVLVGVGVYTNFVKPLKIKPEKVDGVVWNAGFDSIVSHVEDFEKGDLADTVKIESFNGTLPSDEAKDYMTIYFTVEVKNRSLLNFHDIEAVSSEIGKFNENVLFSHSSNEAVPGRVWRLSDSEIAFILDVNVADMDEQAVKDLVKSVKAKVSYKGGILGKREQVIDFSKVKHVYVDFDLD